MNQNTVYIKYEGKHEPCYRSILGLLNLGPPIDEDSGEDLEVSDDFLYKKVNGEFVRLQS
jgi:hypothetical protein